MTTYTGRMGKGFSRTLREIKRNEADGRAAAFEERVQRIMAEQNVTRPTAYRVAQTYPRMEQAKARARADRAAGYQAYVLAEPTPPRASLAWRQGWERALSDERGETVPE